MKNRDYKQFAPGCYYHIYNRGNGKQNIFLDSSDFSFFLFRLREALFPEFQGAAPEYPRSSLLEGSPQAPQVSKHYYARSVLPKNAFSLICYSLIPNHFHFLLKQITDLPLTKLLLKVCTSYSIYFNKKYKRVGHLFQGRFKSVLVDDNEYLKWVSAYIHSNPAVAGLVRNLEDYEWSSYPDYIGIRKGTMCDSKIILDQFPSKSDYKKFVMESSKIIRDRKDVETLLLD